MKEKKEKEGKEEAKRKKSNVYPLLQSASFS